MERNVTGRQRLGARPVALGILLLLASASSFAAVIAQAAPAPVVARVQRVGQATDSLALFTRLMPVLTSARCINCHGGTDPVSGDNHGGGAVGSNAVCADCHTASDQWQSVSGIKFDTDVMPMCQTMRHVVQVIGASTFVSFLGSDPVVGLGFDGLRGMDETSPFWPVDAEPPPLGRDEFVQLANDWVTQGKAACGSGGWNGSISYTETVSSMSPGYEAVDTTVVDIKVVDGQASANIVDNKHETSQTPPGPGCPVSRHNIGSASDQVSAQLSVSVPEGGDAYSISFTTPPVTGTWNIDTLNVGGCNAGRVSRSEPYQVSPQSTFGGKLDPDDPNHLKGTQVNGNGSNLKTTITWDLQLDDE